jgi:hypothetical protein
MMMTSRVPSPIYMKGSLRVWRRRTTPAHCQTLTCRDDAALQGIKSRTEALAKQKAGGVTSTRNAAGKAEKLLACDQRLELNSAAAFAVHNAWL